MPRLPPPSDQLGNTQPFTVGVGVRAYVRALLFECARFCAHSCDLRF